MRLLFWSTASACTGVAVALALWAVLGDAAGAERASAVVGAVVGLAGLVASVYALRRGGQDDDGAVRAAGRGAVAAGGSVTGNAIGADSRVTGTLAAPRGVSGPGRAVSAEGEGAVAAGGDVAGNALGEGGEVAG
ncbi:hypothetical protein DR950_04880 [Kitasatospora xanthocidica]|uniref:Uncharacterized protein n=1 Tax=Kitasatospora xanthocidica TaxID=83382 RepID=A0A372ZNA8_9ACTN|nr:hypothetical protein [Kitasatospora xanthocidica]RGD57221.1 hypothetical protein DR950_04880 [Kitasatospora xanthocidica]